MNGETYVIIGWGRCNLEDNGNCACLQGACSLECHYEFCWIVLRSENKLFCAEFFYQVLDSKHKEISLSDIVTTWRGFNCLQTAASKRLQMFLAEANAFCLICAVYVLRLVTIILLCFDIDWCMYTVILQQNVYAWKNIYLRSTAKIYTAPT